jgi:processive 1,2-diacylglycerol beta-glucosyltransferase
MKTIDLVYFDAGGGHRAAAQALHDLARQQQRPWRVRLVNLTQVLDPRGSFRRLTGFEPEDYYNLRLRRGWTIGLAQELKLLQAMIRLGHAPMVRALERHWRQTRPDLVVSLVPNFNRPMREAVARALPGVPYATVMTDLADHPPHFWIEPGAEQTLVCGTPRAVEQALAAGVPAHRVHATSGMILRPAFYAAAPNDRAATRRALGLDAQAPAGVVMFGGHGSVQMLHIARRLPDVPLIFVCGHNAALLADLKALERPAPHAAVGFTQDVGRLLRAADFFIGKPGPGSLSEAVHSGLPVITFDNAGTMPQERYNVQWVRVLGLGLAVPSVRALRAATNELLANLPEYRQRVRGQRNRAVFEVLDILQALLIESELARTATALRA